ncbi:MAG TPA: ferrous iron transporter B [Phycisphaerales bacterium]|nr:ferrous iron transporter B [Phycisphaerales bacterium]
MSTVATGSGAVEQGLKPALPTRIALIGNPNTGKTTLFNRLSGLRHKTGNFPGTTQEARRGTVRVDDGAFELIDLPGVYSLELEQSEAEVCRRVLAGTLAAPGREATAPDGVLVVVDGTNLARNLVLAGEALRRRLPTVVAVNMMDLARRRGLVIDLAMLEERLGCRVVGISARSGEGLEELRTALCAARVPNRTPPGTREGVERWADETYDAATAVVETGPNAVAVGMDTLTDRLDRVFTHPVLGLVVFAAVMTGLFWVIFTLAQIPMGLIDTVFGKATAWLDSVLPAGILSDFLSHGVVQGVGATVIFLPQICLLFLLISLLEDTGYLARAAFVMDRVLRPFGLPGHSFMPLLSSHACALPGIMACRAIPDRRERLATILVAPFMSCSARIPVYVLLTSILFADRPLMGAVAFTGCYVLGIVAALVTSLLFRRTILKGKGRPMALELPSYKRPSVRTALLGTWDRAFVFVRNAGTNILAIVIVLWWLGAYPRVEPPAAAVQMREQAAAVEASSPEQAEELVGAAERMEHQHASRHSFLGRIGTAVEPVLRPLGYDRQLSVGVMASFAAREVFVSTMAVVTTGSEDAEDEGVLAEVAAAKRDDGTPVFTMAVCWSLLVYYVLAMQCLPTLAVTAREAGGLKWALLQLGWMTGVAYVASLVVYQVLAGLGGA